MSADDLYRKLNQLFSPVHNDNKQQMNESIVLLESAYQEGFTPDDIIAKMNDMIQASDDGKFKSKLSTAILNRFWERNYEKPQDLFRPLRRDE